MPDQPHQSAGLPPITRRGFLVGSACSGTALLFMGSQAMSDQGSAGDNGGNSPEPVSHPPVLPDLEPARWLWYPSERCLQNTFVLFRRELKLDARCVRARGWISADSRYRLEVNGQRVQWGPAPCDARWLEADPIDLTDALVAGDNVIGATVLYYGVGEGTWTMGKPGFLFRLEIETADGKTQQLVSDTSWRAHLCRAWPPGQYKRFFVRALQEEFDAREYPYGWAAPGFNLNDGWLAPLELNASPNDPPVCATNYGDYAYGAQGEASQCELRARSTPLLREYDVPVARLTEQMWFRWNRPPVEYFECTPPNAFEVERTIIATEPLPGTWEIELDGDPMRGAGLTFELAEQVVGWPFFTIDAPEGTTIELLVHEAHEPGGPAMINSHFQSWSRFICREGVNRFEEFDYESVRWIQLHVHGTRGKVTISNVGVRRRIYPWPNEPEITCGEPELQRLIDASVNTLNNSCQETCVDGMGRERQQYSGDCGHQLHAVYMTLGDTKLGERFITTFSQGQVPDGYFLDCWPAYDRLCRLMERSIQLAWWGPLLDHGIGFNFDCWHHYLYTSDKVALEEPYPRLVRFFEYLHTIRDDRGLLKVDDLGIPCVWLDHVAYKHQHHKQCAFNLYAAAMCQHALAPLCEVFGDTEKAQSARRFGQSLEKTTIGNFWSRDRGLFVANLPWLDEEKQIRLCDRSLATSVLFDQCPGDRIDAAVRTLADCPDEMGLSYPANAGWRLWALAKAGRTDVITQDLRERWATMPSVKLNNTLQEDWIAHPDSGSQWSHCAVVPLYILHMSIAGIRPLAPGFARCEIRPQPADLEKLELTTRTVAGPVRFASRGTKGNRDLTITLPEKCEGELVLDEREQIDLDPLDTPAPPNHRRYRLPAGRTARLALEHT